MYESIHKYKWLIKCMFLLASIHSASVFAATITSTAAGGIWSTGSTWVGGNVPAVGDLVIIATTSGNSVTLTGAQTCAGLTINSGAILSPSSFVLTVNGPWLNNGTFNPSTGTVAFGTTLAAINAGSGSGNFNNVQVLSGGTLVVNTPTTLSGSLNYALPAVSNSVTLSNANTLDISGDVNMILPTSNTRSNTMAVGAGALTVAGQFKMLATTTASRANILTVSTGTVNLNGGYSTGTTAPTISTASQLTFTGSGVLNIGGTVSGGAPALTQSTGTVNFTGTGSQGVWIETYYNLGVENGTKNTLGAVTVSNTFTVTSSALTTGGNLTAFNLTLNSGSVTLGGTLTSAGTLNITGGTFNGQTYAITLSGSGSAFLCTGTFNQGTGLLTMSGASETTIPGTTFNNLTVTNGNKTVQSGTTLTVNGNWTHNTTVVLSGTANATVYGLLAGYGAFTMGSGTLTLDSTYSSSGGLTTGTGTIKYVGGGSIRGNLTYYNLEIDGDRNMTAAVTVGNVLTVNASRILNAAGSPLNLTGGGNPIVNNGSIISTTGALTFAGTDPQIVSSGTYPKTTFTNGTKTIPDGAVVNITGAFLVSAPLVMEGNGSATITGAATGAAEITMGSGSLTFISTFAGGTFTAGTGKVVYDGTAAQAVRVGINYYDLELSSSVSNSIASTTMTIANNFIVGAPTTTTTSTTLNIGNDVTGSGDFTANGFINLAGDWLHNGAFTPGTGTIHYNGTDQLVKNLSYYKLSLTGGTKSLEGNTIATNLVTINSGTTLNMNAYILDLQGATVNTLVNSGTLSGNGKVKYSAAGAQTINSSVFFDLEFTGGDKTIATGNTIEATNDWTVSSNVLMTSTQNATVGRDLIHNTGALIDQGSGIIRIGRNWIHNGGTFDAGTGTVIYEGGDQTIAPFTYATLVCDGTGTKSITGNIIITGVLTINPGVTFDRDAYNVTLSFNGTPFVNNGTLTGNGKFFYTGTGTQNIAPGSYYDLEFSTGQKNLPADETLTILNDWTIASLTVFGNNTIVSVGGDINGAGTFTLGNGTLTLAGSWNKTGTFTAANTGIFHYNGAEQNIAALDYYKLQVSNAGVKSLTASTTVRNEMTVNPSASVNLGSHTLTLSFAGTPLVNNGTFIPVTSTVSYTGVGATTIAPGDYYNLSSSSGARELIDGGIYNIAGSFTPGAPSYTSVTGSSVRFNGPGSQTIPAFTFHELILGGSGTKTIPDAADVTVYEIEIAGTAQLDLPGTAEIFIVKP